MKAMISVLVLLALMGGVALAFPPRVPATTARVEWDVVYRTVDGLELKMDIYYPRVGSPSYPALLYVHGGGWTSGSRRGGAGMRDLPILLARGYVVAAVDYRLAPEWKFPAQIQDVKCAVRYLRAHADALGIDPDRIGAYGGSAGGHLVALLGTADDDAFPDNCPWEASSRVQAVVDMFGPADFSLFDLTKSNKALQVFGTEDLTDPIFAQASPVTWASPDDPPFLILHGNEDQVVPLEQSQRLYERLQAAGVPVELVIVKNAGHGFRPVGGEAEPTREEISNLIADFFDRYLK